jgi:hypothetical protein
LLAVGDLIQVAHGDQVNAHLVFRFKDGSVDDERTIYSQRGHFSLLTDHRVQKGPFFPHSLDVFTDVRRGEITVRSTGENGEVNIKIEHVDLPTDLANGLVTTLAKNLSPTTHATTVSMVVATPKLRIVHLEFTPQGKEPLLIAGSRRSATRFAVKAQLGGVTGIVAPLIGKQPKDGQIWILGGEAPAFVKADYQPYTDGPVCSIQLTSPVWPRESQAK